jgi:uncharacterized protein YeaO (DUF488 family)
MSRDLARGAIRLKRVYDPPSADDGMRVLVDRLWPRGLRKSEAAIDRWMQTVAPSTALRQWFGHDVARWAEFQRRYRDELRNHAAELDELRHLARQGPLTLLFAAHDPEHNNAAVLRELLLRPGHAGQDN